jgi:hypothetical protein
MFTHTLAALLTPRLPVINLFDSSIDSLEPRLTFECEPVFEATQLNAKRTQTLICGGKANQSANFNNMLGGR